jgi:hypothetical protein
MMMQRRHHTHDVARRLPAGKIGQSKQNTALEFLQLQLACCTLHNQLPGAVALLRACGCVRVCGIF